MTRAYIKEKLALRLFGVFLMLSFWGSFPGGADATSLVRRALFVHHEQGWKGERKLRYTRHDVSALANVLNRKGNFHIDILSNPDAAKLKEKLALVHRQIKEARDRGLVTHFLFYYSGHADRDYLHLGPESQKPSKRFHLKTLASSLKRLPTTIKIVILDTCYAGALIEMIGGTTKGRRPQRAKYFSVSKNPQKVTAVLASSVSQSIELNRLAGGSYIRKSIFTHYLVEALKGQADRKEKGFGNGDGNVSISEAFAYTRHKTIQAVRGLQDPTRYLEIKGHNGYPLTTFHNARVSLPAERGDIFILSGVRHGVLLRLQIDNPDKRVVSVLSGQYKIFIRSENSQCYQSVFRLQRGRSIKILARQDFKPFPCPKTLFWAQKGPASVFTKAKRPGLWDVSSANRRRLSLSFSGGKLVETVVPPYLGATVGFGHHFGSGIGGIELSFQTGSRAEFLSFYPELALSWKWAFSKSRWELTLGPLVGLGVLVVLNNDNDALSSGLNIRYGAVVETGFFLTPRFSLGLGLFVGGTTSQHRIEDGERAWATSFSMQGTLGFRFHM